MTLAFSPDENNPAIADFIADQTLSPLTFNSKIHADDEMLIFLLQAFKGDRNQALLSYFKSGQEAMNRVRQVVNWRFKDLAKIESFLDFACGYGRFTRFLVQELSPQKIWVADIYTNAVKFQQEEFGVTGLFSVPHPENFQCDRKFDFIFVASLFSHLPESTFVPWLKVLFNLLTPQGILLFSVHDEAILLDGLTMPESGFYFQEISESRSLDTQQYGSTWVAERYVKTAIAQATNNQSSYLRIAKGLWQQDLYLVVKDSAENFDNFEFLLGPRGYLGKCEFLDHYQLFLRGWAVDLDQYAWIQDIQILINHQLVQRCIPYEPRLGVSQTLQDERYLKSGWSCQVSLPLNLDLDTARLMVKIISFNGLERVICAGLLRETLLKNSGFIDVDFQKNYSQPKFKLSLGDRVKLLLRKTKQHLLKQQQPTIQGCLEGVNWQNSLEAIFEGWAIATDTHDRIIDIQIWINGQLKQRCIPQDNRVDVAKRFGSSSYLKSGWKAQCEIHHINHAGILIKAVTQQKAEQIIYAGMLKDALS